MTIRTVWVIRYDDPFEFLGTKMSAYYRSNTQWAFDSDHPDINLFRSRADAEYRINCIKKYWLDEVSREYLNQPFDPSLLCVEEQQRDVTDFLILSC